ncbi:MAG TPA: hypothetical protein VFM60_06895 [Salinimicrobium sp.]|nr:hypothetical protein [Salinimicrobium sp.]
MKTLTTFFLSFIFLFQSFGSAMDICCDLVKIPNLIEHYNEQALVKGISITDFIDQHYGVSENSLNHENDSHDEDLPFQGSHSCCNFIAYVSFSEMETFSLKTTEAQTLPIFYRFPFSTASLSAVFQPPRV